MRIQNYSNSATILAHAEREYPGKKVDKLVFRYANDQYFLAEIWGEQGSEGMSSRLPTPSPGWKKQNSVGPLATKHWSPSSKPSSGSSQ